jgi:hypothetical protein
MAKRMRAKLREIKEQHMAIRHEGAERQGPWLCQFLRGWPEECSLAAVYRKPLPTAGKFHSDFKRTFLQSRASQKAKSPVGRRALLHFLSGFL